MFKYKWQKKKMVVLNLKTKSCFGKRGILSIYKPISQMYTECVLNINRSPIRNRVSDGHWYSILIY